MTRILKNSISRKILQLFHLYKNYCILLLNKRRSSQISTLTETMFVITRINMRIHLHYERK